MCINLVRLGTLLVNQTVYAGNGVASHAGVQCVVNEDVAVNAEELLAETASEDDFIGDLVNALPKSFGAAVTFPDIAGEVG